MRLPPSSPSHDTPFYLLWMFGLMFSIVSCQAKDPPSPAPASSNSNKAPQSEKTTSETSSNQKPELSGKQIENARSTAEKLLETLLLGKWKSSEALFAAPLKEALSPEQLESNWKTAVKDLGTYQTLEDPTASNFESGMILQYKMNFAKGHLSTKIVVSGDSKIVGLWFFPTVKTDDPTQEQLDYSFEAAGLTTNTLEVGVPGWELPASLVLPSKDVSSLPPVVILIPGSGPQDRNATIGKNQPFFQLALELGARGIATLRFEKRTLRHKKKAGLLSQFTVEHEFIEDAVSAFETLRQRNDIDNTQIFFAGHSLGGTVLPRIAEKTKGVSGLIMMAAAARAPHELIEQQVGYLSQFPETGMTPDKRQEIMKDIKQVQNIAEGKTPNPQVRPFGIPQSYWVDLTHYKPAQRAKALNLPMLFLQGGRDYQSSMADFEMWQTALKGQKNVMFKAYPNLNHIFQEGSKPSLPSEYLQKKGMPSYLFDDISSFIKRTARIQGSKK